jgi:hypothetical protein
MTTQTQQMVASIETIPVPTFSDSEVEEIMAEIRAKAARQVDRLLYNVALAAVVPSYIETLEQALMLYDAKLKAIGEQRAAVHKEQEAVKEAMKPVEANLYRPPKYKSQGEEIVARSEAQRKLTSLKAQAGTLLMQDAVLSEQTGKFSEPARRLQSLLAELRAIKAPPVPGWLLDWLTIDRSE